MDSDNNKPESAASDGDEGLPLKKRLFAAQYHAERNATQAAIRAGYSAKTAQQAGSRLLKDAGVQAELVRLAEQGGEPAHAPKALKPAPKKLGRPRKVVAPQQPQQAPATAKQQAEAAPVTRRLLERVGAIDPTAAATTPTEEAFITEYLTNGMNATAAAVACHPGVTLASAKATAWQILRRPRVVARIKAERQRMASQHEMSRDQLLMEFLAIVRADPNELMQMRAVACPACWPGDTANRGRWTDPDPECSDCMGEGDSIPWFADTRKLSPEARALFAGVKITKDGATILTHDKMAALVNIGKILGAYEKDNEQKKPELTEALAQFVGQLHGEGAGRLQFTPRAPAAVKVQH